MDTGVLVLLWGKHWGVLYVGWTRSGFFCCELGALRELLLRTAMGGVNGRSALSVLNASYSCEP